MKHGKVNGRIYLVFEDEDEFRNYFMKKNGVVPKLVRDWRNGKTGDWVLADDGGVTEIIKQGEMRHPHDRPNWKAHKGWCRTIVGSFPQNNKTEMDTDFDLHPNRYTFGKHKTLRDYAKIRKTREELTKGERIFAWEFSTGKSLQQAYESGFSPKANWREDAVFLLKTKRIQDEIMKNVREVADNLGITYEYVLNGLKTVAEQETGNVRLGALKEMGDIIGMKDEARSTKQVGELTMFKGFDNAEVVGELEEAERKRLEAQANS